MAEVGSLLGTAENLTNLWRARICKISRQKCRICKFLRQNFVFVNFCNKNVTFSNTRYPKIPDYSENISGRVRVLLKIIGSGRVSGTRLTLLTGGSFIGEHLSPRAYFIKVFTLFPQIVLRRANFGNEPRCRTLPLSADVSCLQKSQPQLKFDRLPKS